MFAEGSASQQFCFGKSLTQACLETCEDAVTPGGKGPWSWVLLKDLAKTRLCP